MTTDATAATVPTASAVPRSSMFLPARVGEPRRPFLWPSAFSLFLFQAWGSSFPPLQLARVRVPAAWPRKYTPTGEVSPRGAPFLWAWLFLAPRCAYFSASLPVGRLRSCCNLRCEFILPLFRVSFPFFFHFSRGQTRSVEK